MMVPRNFRRNFRHLEPQGNFRISPRRVIFSILLYALKMVFTQIYCPHTNNFFACFVDLTLPPSSHLKGQKCPDEESSFFLDIGFKKKYGEMMREFRVFVYPEGNPRTFFRTPKNLTRLYASEAYFFRNMEQSPLRTMNPEEADMFFIPISVQKMSEKRLSLMDMRNVARKYIRGISSKYPYWNRTSGVDHFFVSCHQMALKVTQGVPDLVKRDVRIVCYPDRSDGYIKEKDLALPPVLLPFEYPAAGSDKKKRTRLILLGGDDISEEIALLDATKAENLMVNNHTISLLRRRTREYKNIAPWTLDYNTSKFCLCPGGSQMCIGRIADAIHYGCVPVVWPDRYQLPFSSMMKWSAFSVQIKEDYYLEFDVLKFLEEIPEAEYRNLQSNTVKAQKYFQWNSPPIKYDAFHQIMYQLWRRLDLKATNYKITLAIPDSQDLTMFDELRHLQLAYPC